jgi:TP901 family phage tail tape measure protein
MAGASLGTAEGRITVDAGQAISSIQQVGQALDRLGTQATVGQEIGNFNQSVVGLAQGMQHLGRVGVGLGTAITAPFALGVKSAMDYESTLAGVNAVMGLTEDQMKTVSDVSQQLGRDTIFTGQQVATGIEELGRAGISFEDVVGGAAQAATDLAAAGGTDVPKAAQVMAAAMAAFNITGEDSMRVADGIAGAANTSLSDINQMGIGMGQVAGIAAAANMTFEETAAFMAMMADNGIRGSDAATSMKSALVRLLSPTDTAVGVMEDLGISLLDAEGNFVGLAGASQEFFDAWKRSGQTLSEFMEPLGDVLGTDAIRAILFGMQALEAQQTGIGKGWDEYINAVSDVGAAHDFAEARMDSTAGAIERLRGTVGTLAEEFGMPLNTALRQPIESLNTFLGRLIGLPAPIRAVVSTAGLLTGGMTALGGAFLLVGGYVLEAVARFSAAGINLQMLLGLFGRVAAAATIAGAAIGVAAIAYQNNWFGLRDAIEDVLDLLGEVGDEARKGAEAASRSGRDMNALEEAVYGLGVGLSKSGIPAVETFGKFLITNLSEGLYQARKLFNDLTKKGISPLVAGLRAASKFVDIFTGIAPSDLAKTLGDVADKAQLFGDVFAGMQNTPALSAMSGLTNTVYALGAAFNSIGWTTIGAGLINLASIIETADRAWQSATRNGLNPLAAALQVVGVVADKMNWDGLSERIKEASDAAQRFGDAFSTAQWFAMMDGATGLSQVLQGLASAVRTLGFEDLANKLNDTAVAVDRIVGAFNSALTDGLNPFEAGLFAVDTALDMILSADQEAALDGISQRIQDMADSANNLVGSGLGRVGQLLSEIGSAVAAGDFSGVVEAFRSLGTDIKTEIDKIIATAQTIDIGQIAVNISEFIKGAVPDLVNAIKGFFGFGGDAQAGLGGTGASEAVIDVPGILVNIGEFLQGTIPDLWSSIMAFFGLGGGPTGATRFPMARSAVQEAQTGINIPAIAVNIGGFIQGSIADLWGTIQGWFGFGSANSMGGPGERGEAGTASAGLTLEDVAVNIGSWAQGAWATLGDLAGQVEDWIRGQLESAGITVENFTAWGLSLGMPGMGGDPNGGGSFRGGTQAIDWAGFFRQQIEEADVRIEDFTGYEIDLGSPSTIDLADADAAVSAILKPINDLVTSPAFVAEARRVGEELGTKAGTELGSALNDAIMDAITTSAGEGFAAGAGSRDSMMAELVTGAGLGGGTGLDLTSALEGFSDAFIEAFKTAFAAEMQEAAAALPPYIAQEMANTLSGLLGMEILPAEVAGVSPGDRGQQVGAMIAEAVWGGPGGAIGAYQRWLESAEGQAAQQGNIADQTAQQVSEVGGQVVEGQRIGLGETVTEMARAAATQNPIADFLSSGLWDAINPFPTGVDPNAKAAELFEPIPPAIGAGTGKAIAAAEQQAREAATQESTGLTTAIDAAMGQSVAGATLDQFATGIGQAINTAILEGIEGAAFAGEGGPRDMGPAAGAGIGNQIATTLATSIQGADFSLVGEAISSQIQSTIATGLSRQGTGEGTEGAAEAGGGIGAAVAGGLAASIRGADFAEVGTAIQAKINEGLTAGLSAEAAPEAGAAGGTGASIGQSIATSMASAIQMADFSAVGIAINAKISESLAAGLGAVNSMGGPGERGEAGTASGAGIGASIVNSIVTDIQGADFSALGTALQTGITGAVTEAINAVGPEIQNATNGWIGTFQNAFSSMANTASANMQGLSQTVSTQMAGVGNTITSMMNAAIASVQNGFSSMANTASSNMAALTQAVSSGFSQIGQVVTSMTNSMITSTQNAMSSMANTAASNMQAFSSAVQSGMDAAVSAVQGGVTNMQGILEGAAGGAFSAGANVGQAFADGISSAIGAVEAAAGALAAAAQGAINLVQQISSPSKVAIHQGEMVGEGFAIGIERMISRAMKAGLDLGKGVKEGIKEIQSSTRELDNIALRVGEIPGLNTLQSSLSDISGSISGNADEARSGLDDLMTSVKEKLGQLEDDMRNRGREAGAAVGEGLASGLGSASGATAGAGENVIKGLRDQIRQALDNIPTVQREDIKGAKSIVGDLQAMKADVNELRGIAERAGDIPGLHTLEQDLNTVADNIDAAREPALESAKDLVKSLEQTFKDSKEAMRAVMKDLSKDLASKIGSGIKEAIPAATEAATGVGDAAATGLNANLSRLPEMAEAMGTDTGQALGTGLDSTIPSVQESAGNVGESIGTGLSTAAPAATEAGAGLVDSAVTGMTDAANSQSSFSQQIGELIAGTFGDGFASGIDPTAATTMVKSYGDGIRNAVMSMMPNFQQAGTQVGSSFAAGVDQSNPTQSGTDLVKEVGTGIDQGVGATGNAANQAGESIGSSLTSGIDSACAPVNSTANDLTESCIPEGINSGLKDATNVAQNAGQDISNSLMNGLDIRKKDVERSFGNAGTGFSNAMGTGIAGARESVIGKARDVANAAGTVSGKSQGQSVGESIGQGIAAGVTSTIPEIRSAVEKAVQEGVDAAKDESKSKSPSLVFMDIGADWMRGAAMGVENLTPTLNRAVSSSTREMIDVFRGTGVGQASRILDLNLDRYTSRVAGTLTSIERMVTLSSLPKSALTDIADRTSAQVTRSEGTTVSGGTNITIAGIEIKEGEPGHRQAIDLVNALRKNQGQYRTVGR